MRAPAGDGPQPWSEAERAAFRQRVRDGLVNAQQARDAVGENRKRLGEALSRLRTRSPELKKALADADMFRATLRDPDRIVGALEKLVAKARATGRLPEQVLVDHFGGNLPKLRSKMGELAEEADFWKVAAQRKPFIDHAFKPPKGGMPDPHGMFGHVFQEYVIDDVHGPGAARRFRQRIATLTDNVEVPGGARFEVRSLIWDATFDEAATGGNLNSPETLGRVLRNEVGFEKSIGARPSDVTPTRPKPKPAPPSTVGDNVYATRSEQARMLTQDVGGVGSAKRSGGGGGSGGVGKLAEEVGEEATQAAERTGVRSGLKSAAKAGGKMVGKIALGIGKALLPSPLDVAFLIQGLGDSLNEARAEIRRNKRVDGFATGWASYLISHDWWEARHFERTYNDMDVATQVLDAVGIAKNAFNEGLLLGFAYAEQYSDADSNRMLDAAANAYFKLTQEWLGAEVPGTESMRQLRRPSENRKDASNLSIVLLPLARRMLGGLEKYLFSIRRTKLPFEGEAKTYGAWISVAGEKRLAVIDDAGPLSPRTGYATTNEFLRMRFVGWVPDDLKSLVERRTRAVFGSVPTIDNPEELNWLGLRDALRSAKMEIGARRRRQEEEARESKQRQSYEQEFADLRERIAQPIGLQVRGSVGEGGVNDPDDVTRVSRRLRELGFLKQPTTDLEQIGDAIYDYQLIVLGSRKPDGRIDPRGKTEAALRAGRKHGSMALR
jgi:hypothetical protein